jgi:hypothetical protein
MKLLVLGDRESGAVINFDNFTRCFRKAGKKEIHLFFAGLDKPVQLRGEEADTVWNFLVDASREQM